MRECSALLQVKILTGRRITISSPSFSGRRPLYCRYSPLQLLVSETFQFPLVPVPVALLPQLPSQTRHHGTVVKLVLGRRGPDRRRLLLPLCPLLILPRIVADGQMPQITEQVILRNRVRRSCLSIPSVTHSFGKWASAGRLQVENSIFDWHSTSKSTLVLV